MSDLVGVRQAAKTLGVHENTLRRWEERGLLRAVRLPSGVRRFRSEDVDELRARMFSGFAPLRDDDDIAPPRDAVGPAAIETAAQALADAALSPARVLVFGSHARGDAGPASDVDFLVIERDPVPNRAVEMARLRDVIPPLGVPVDVLVLSEQQAAERARRTGSVIATALAEGREVARS